MLSAIKDFESNPQRVQKYIPFERELNMEGISYPVQIQHIPKFETQNLISINLYGYDDGEIFPLCISKSDHTVHVDLLLLKDEQKSHYVWIKNFSSFLSHLTKHDGARFYCRFCLHRFSTENLLNDHITLCKNHIAQKIQMPDATNNILSFKNYQFQLKVPFRIYADFECFLCKVQGCSPNPETQSSTILHKHVPSGFCYLVVSDEEKYSKPPVVYRGPDVMKHFIIVS